jgi:Asp-tRNA(Asn)/Glu-tRNA(Gln) amidotransferase A subunit family amidase
MATKQANELSATEALARIRAGELTSEALVRACLTRIDAREAAVGAWQHLDREGALAAARAADRVAPRGALHGIPVGVKDIIDTADMPTALGSTIYAKRRPEWDAACVAAIRAAGGIVLGKTVTTEFAYFTPGRTRNPHHLEHTPGGSSSGSAAAVADFMVPLALGTQTAGSVIRPATFCGVVGYKASFGEFTLAGVRPFAESLDTLGGFARSVADLALLRAVLTGAPLPGSDAAPLPALGWCRTPQWEAAEPCVRDALRASVERLERAGVDLREIGLPPRVAALVEAQKTIMAYEAARNYRFEMQRHGERLSERLRALIEAGERTPYAAWVAARRDVAQARREWAAGLDARAAVLVPAAVGEAPLAGSGTGDPLMNRIWTALGVPCLAVPVQRGPHGLPVGVQLVGAADDDDRLLRIGGRIAGVLAAG